MRDLVNAGALDLIVATAEAGAKPDEARSWWGSGLVTNEAAYRAGRGSQSEQVARFVALVNEGKLTNSLLARLSTASWQARVTLMRSSQSAGSRLCVTTVPLRQPWTRHLPLTQTSLRSTRPGNTKVTGAIVGAVMKATRGKADPAQVNKLIAEKLK